MGDQLDLEGFTARAKRAQEAADRIIREEKAKQRGMEVAAAHNDDVLESFRELAVSVAERARTAITIDDVREEASFRGLKYTPGNWMGSVFKGPRWRWDGTFVPSKHHRGHRRMVRCWSLLKSPAEGRNTLP